jgi:2-haloacid dehalogenase
VTGRVRAGPGKLDLSQRTSGARLELARAMPEAWPMDTVKALFFDVFGTLVDWRSGIARESERLLAPLGHRLDWAAFADAWRGEYQPAMEEVRAGRIPFSKLDVLHRLNLERILPRFGLGGLPEEVLQALNRAWHVLPAWPEVPGALARLKPLYILAPVSNGNISLMVDLARANDLPWDAVLGAEIAGDYKPKPGVYLSSARALDLAPGECMMWRARTSTDRARARPGRASRSMSRSRTSASSPISSRRRGRSDRARRARPPSPPPARPSSSRASGAGTR